MSPQWPPPRGLSTLPVRGWGMTRKPEEGGSDTENACDTLISFPIFSPTPSSLHSFIFLYFLLSSFLNILSPCLPFNVLDYLSPVTHSPVSAVSFLGIRLHLYFHHPHCCWVGKHWRKWDRIPGWYHTVCSLLSTDIKKSWENCRFCFSEEVSSTVAS